MDQETFEKDAIDIKKMLIANGNKKNGDGYIVNYYNFEDKIHLVKLNGTGNLTYSFNKDKVINIEKFINIKNENNNFKIPIFDNSFTKISEQRIYFDYQEKEFKKVFSGTFKNVFYYYKKNTEISVNSIIFSEGVADSMLMLQNLEEVGINTSDFCIVSALSDSNMINVFNNISLLPKFENTKKIYYLIDNDKNNVGLNTYLKIKELNTKFEILPILSYNNDLKDFCDIYNFDDKTFLNEINNNIKDFNDNKMLILNVCYNNINVDFNKNSNFITNTIIKSIIKSLTIYNNNYNFDDKDFIKLLNKISKSTDFYDFDYKNIIEKIKQFLNNN